MQTRSLIFSLSCGVLLASALGAPAIQSKEQQSQIEVFHVPALDAGFHLLYQLKLAEARAQFQARQKSHPGDPLGSASEAASYLFEECYRQGILTSDFFALSTGHVQQPNHITLTFAFVLCDCLSIRCATFSV